MLRPTESPIIFVQQLGRGLRKIDNKEFVVVIDFIGNYQNNFMIPVALSGDRSGNKDNVRKYVGSGERVIPGASTVHFDEIAKKRIHESLDAANFSDVRLIKQSYTNLKNKLGRIPTLMDFDRYGEIDPQRIFDNNSLGSYYTFLKKNEKEYDIRISADEEQIIKFVSQKLASGKRVHELVLLKKLIEDHHFQINGLANVLLDEYGVRTDDEALINIINVMTNAFPQSQQRKKFASCIFVEKNTNRKTMMMDDYKIADAFEKMLENQEFVVILNEILDFGIMRYQRDYSDRYKDTDLVLYKKYTYEDVCRLLKWEKNEVPLNIGGYKYDAKTKTFPVFINYDKEDGIQDTIKYEDHFTSPQSLIAISKSGRTLESDDVKKFLNAEELGIDVELFVRKNKDDAISKEFYYLGRMKATGNTEEFIMPNTSKVAVEIEWILDTPVREDLYQYIVNE